MSISPAHIKTVSRQIHPDRPVSAKTVAEVKRLIEPLSEKQIDRGELAKWAGNEADRAEKKLAVGQKNGDLVFSLGHANQKLGSQASIKDCIRFTAKLEYLTAELMEIAGNMAMVDDRRTILPRDLEAAIKSDSGLRSMFGGKQQTKQRPKQQQKQQAACNDMSHLKKYRTRKSPPRPANSLGCRGRTMMGNDYRMYESRPHVSRGQTIYTWKLSSPKKQKSQKQQKQQKKQRSPPLKRRRVRWAVEQKKHYRVRLQEKCPDMSHLKKYRTRKSPPRPANSPECRGRKMLGNDGTMYESFPHEAGGQRIFTWKKVK
jgi:hypothetical protein